MTAKHGWAFLAAIAAFVFLPQAAAEQRSLSQDWRFQRGDSKGAEAVAYDDRSWRQVSVPHDWSIEDKPDGSPPFDRDALSGQDSGYLPGGVGWYRRHLVLDARDVAQTVRVRFEAIYMDADVWINGRHVEKHHYGYSAFSVDLTGKLHAGDNLLAIRVDHADPSSRWYAGSGLIRPATLELLPPVHIEPDSIQVTTPVATRETGKVVARSDIVNGTGKTQSVEVISHILSPAGQILLRQERRTALAPGAKATEEASFELSEPALWSPDSPNLYVLEQSVRTGDGVSDVRRTRFGIRTIAVDAVNGLRINGKRFLLRGGNIHHDNYMLGAAGLPDAEARKVALMKAAGYNAIRSAHNPASQATLDAADELGMLVVDEAFDAWSRNKKSQDYARFFKEDWPADLDSLIVSGRNHPSVLFWSIGNEIPEQGAAPGIETARRMVARVRRLDATRPVTQAVSTGGVESDGQFAVLDVAGYNYHAHEFADDHRRFPARVMFTSESTSKDAFTYWRSVETMPWVLGDFVWTAVDYLGETGIGWMGYSQDWQKLGPYPWHLAYSGEIDATGRKRPAAYYREVLWKTGIDPIAAFVRQPPGTEDLPDRHLFPITPPHLDWSLDDVHPSWTWPGQEGKPLDVVVYAEYPEVELFLNGKSLGRKPVGVDTEYKTSYQVPYSPGRLVAVGYRDNRPVGHWELRTDAEPAALRLSVDRTRVRANGEDLAYVTAELFDADGVPIYAQSHDRPISVQVDGAGRLAGVGNGDPHDASSFQSGRRHSFHGRLVAVVKAATQAGPVQVRVEVPGLPAQEVRIDAVSP
ncbi:glycoside hydrolase family 2 TIM barrel-domain containing protein [Dyella sp. 2RAB6]|uniref:glycoside hydrolase family 2 TIM barrel-domain containing protein n=1 Tax=Dyella sp. 2RAB6 TaxID=3232992 RepID=UPI003F92AE0C